ncbi:MAG: DUF6799 domain-containing protein, partial [Chthoniobacteraceae bacterium]
MKTSLLFVVSILSAQILGAQTVVKTPAASARDGFTKFGTDIVITRNGVSQKVEKETILEGGLRVRPDGTVTLPNGDKASLRNNQLLTMQGTFEDVALTPQGTAPLTSGGSPPKQEREIGISANDGISVSEGATVVTRNRVTERLSKEMKLANGTRVLLDGTVIMPDGQKMSLRADQVLTLDGVLAEAPARPNPAPAALDGIVVHDGRAYLLRGGRAFLIDAALVPDGQMLTNTG